MNASARMCLGCVRLAFLADVDASWACSRGRVGDRDSFSQLSSTMSRLVVL
jgi:hypothetical protein